MASGMPWPRIFSLPKRAIRPMMSEPTTGTPTAQTPSGESCNLTSATLKRPK